MRSRFHDEPVERFYEQFNRQIARMPQVERSELQLELRQHLDGLVAAYEEIGCSPEEAVESALRRFGDPKKIGRGLYREWRRTDPERAATVTMIVTLVALFPAGCLALLASASPFTDGALVAPALLAGLITGWKHPGGTWRGALWGAASVAGAVLLPLLVLPPLVGGYRQFYSISESASLLGAACSWLPLACLAAAFGRTLRHRQRVSGG